MANRKFLSPVYANLSASDDATRLNPQVRSSDCRTIVSVTGDTHSLSHICQLFIKATADYVRLHKLDFTSQDKLSEFLRERSVVTPPATEAVASDDAGRNAGSGKQVTNTTNGQPIPGTGVKTGRSGAESKGGKVRGTRERKSGKS